MTKNFIKRLPKNQYIGGNCLKRGGGGARAVSRFGGGLAKKKGGGYPNAHYGPITTKPAENIVIREQNSLS